MFPINDEPSAHLMLVKALCLLQCGSIDITEAAAVFRKASETVYRPEPPQLRKPIGGLKDNYAPDPAMHMCSLRESSVAS
jgi:hypothetical protein